MKKILLSLITVSTLLLFACKKTSVDESSFQLKTKPLSHETLRTISQKLKDRGFVNNRNFNAVNSLFRTETNYDAEIVEIVQPLIDNGRELQTELISFVESSQEWQGLTLVERNEIIQMSDEQLADLSLAYSGVQTQGITKENISSAIKDCVSTALGIAGIKGLVTNIITGPSVSSAIGILKWFGKRYLSYIGIAWMIWDFTDCMSHF